MKEEYTGNKRTGAAERNRAKVGRNDPCPCGSGNKFKKCCIKDSTSGYEH